VKLRTQPCGKDGDNLWKTLWKTPEKLGKLRIAREKILGFDLEESGFNTSSSYFKSLHL